jgi:hypothetical protein
MLSQGKNFRSRRAKNEEESKQKTNDSTKSNAGCMAAQWRGRALLGWTDECVRPYVILCLPRTARD